jgi:Fur family transcriptional regulator, zinc uptake regulator
MLHNSHRRSLPMWQADGSAMAGRKGAEHARNIMGALQDASRPLSAYDLLDKLRPTGVGAPLTVYRALDKLIASGKVHRIESLNAFVACRSGEHHHVHTEDDQALEAPRSTTAFAICDRCGTVEEFVDESLFAQLDEGLVKRGFAPQGGTIEVRGLCASCSASAGERGQGSSREA